MKRILVLTIVTGLLTGATHAHGQSAADAYQSALQLEEVKGDLDGAIAAYRSILERFPNNRAVNGKAQLHLAVCYERLAKPEARAAYEAVVEHYADQPELVTQAKARLASMAQALGGAAQNGMVVRQVWAGPGVDVEGKPSRDGRYLTYVDWTSTDTGNVAIRDLTTGENRRLTDATDMAESFAEYPVLSPDGKTIAYGWNNSIRLIGIDGSRPRVLVAERGGLYPYDLTWSPDGTRIAAAMTDYGRDKTSQIVLISVGTGSITRLKSTGWRSPGIGEFSPDGRFLLYTVGRSATGDDQDILMLSVDGTSETALVEGPSNDTQPSWTLDGKAILFVSDRSGSKGLWAIRVDQGTPKASPELIRPNVGDIWPKGFTRDGSFFYGLINHPADLYVAGLDPETLALTVQPEPLTDRFVGSNSGGSWSPDGRLIAFVRGPDRRSKNLVIRSVSDGAERTLPTKLMDAYFPAQMGPTWFPDGHSLLVSDTDEPKRKTVFRRVDVQTGQESLVFEKTYESMWPSVALAPDGKALFYTNSEGDVDPKMSRLHLVRRDLETGAETELYRAVSDGAGFFGLTISPDGRQLAFMANVGPNQRNLMTLSTNGGTPVVLVRGGYANPQPQTLVWTRDGKYILFKAQDGRQRTQVWAVPVDGGPARRTGLATSASIGKMDLSPDGKRLVFTGTKLQHELWVIKNLMSGFFPRN
jgi:Tol biopolymer transport system component